MANQKPQGEAVSSNQETAKETALQPQQAQQQQLEVSGDGDVSGSLALALSQVTQDQAVKDFLESLHQVQEGFGDLSKPGDIYDRQEVFEVIDAVTIEDYEDRRKGEILTKHVFKLQFLDGRIAFVMQSNARPRKMLALMFTSARLNGIRAIAGPYKFVKKVIPGQPQAAYIFEQQPGFRAVPIQPPALAARPAQ